MLDNRTAPSGLPTHPSEPPRLRLVAPPAVAPVNVSETRADALRISARGLRRALAVARELPDDDDVKVYLSRLATRMSMAAELHHPPAAARLEIAR